MPVSVASARAVSSSAGLVAQVAGSSGTSPTRSTGVTSYSRLWGIARSSHRTTVRSGAAASRTTGESLRALEVGQVIERDREARRRPVAARLDVLDGQVAVPMVRP